MRRTALLLLLVALLDLTACRHDPPTPTAPPPDAGPRAPVASAKTDDASRAEIIDEGREPRSPLIFAFVPGRHEARVLALESLLELKGETRVNDRLELRFDVTYPTADTVELVLRHAETTAADVKGIASTVGAVVKQQLGKAATGQPPEVTFPDSADGTAAQYVKGAVVQGTTAFLPSLPAAPVGEGARWKWGGEDGATCDLVSRRDRLVVLDRTTEIHGVRRREKGKAMIVNEDQRMRIETPLDGIARHVEATFVDEKVHGTKRTTHLRFEVIDKAQ
jgi:hypothetical protein